MSPAGGRWSRRLATALWLAVVVACLATVVVTLRQRSEVEGARTRAELAASRAERAGDEADSRLDRLRRSLGDARAAEQRDQVAATWISRSVEELELLAGRLAEAEADLVGLTELSEAQAAQIGVLRGCVATLDAVREALGHGDADAAAVHLEAGRQGCRDAEVLADGASTAVHPFDFPDPHVLAVDGTYHAFGTNGPAGSVQVLTSTDLAEWRVRGSALSTLPDWAQPGFTWAPAALRTLEGYALYYTVRHRDSGRQCVSVATATAPTGPYVDRSAGPLVCQLDQGGSIDASPYQDDEGRMYLTWKSEGEVVGRTSTIWARPLAPDGTALIWFPSRLVVADRPWEGGVVEAPSMVRTPEGWILLYSGNSWRTDTYAVGHARCEGPTGPCTKPEANVVLSSGSEVRGPGGAEAFRTTDGELMIAYAGWEPGQVGPPNPRRLRLATLRVTPDAVHVA